MFSTAEKEEEDGDGMIEAGFDFVDVDLEDTDKGTALGNRELGEGGLIVIWIIGLAG